MRTNGWLTLLLYPYLRGLASSAYLATTSQHGPKTACYMQYERTRLLNKSIDFENPSVFELLASNYSRERSPFFELLHRARDCVTLSYWINNEPDSENYCAKLRFACGVQELLTIQLVHVRNSDVPDDFCISMLHEGRPLEQYRCGMLALSQRHPLTLQVHVGSMVILSQETPITFDYLLFQRVTRYPDMRGTLRYFAARYNVPVEALQPRNYYTSEQWLRCDCDAIMRSLVDLYQCLGIPRKHAATAAYSVRRVSEDVLVMAAIGIGGGVTFFLLLKIRQIC